MQSGKLNAFTLIEMLVVVGIIALLISIIIPALSAAKNASKIVVCKTNLRQLAIANQNYANENHSFCVPGAVNLTTTNLHRWYGGRTSKNEHFDTTKGPLAPYLQQVKLECPQRVIYTDVEASNELYEKGNGGYGYNLTYIGSNIWSSGLDNPDTSQSQKLTDIRQPQNTLLFTDTAFASKQLGFETALIRYGFAEPRYFVVDKEPSETWTPSASIHFRHRNRACIAWADGHADHRKTANFEGFDEEGIRPKDFDLGWFDPMDNSLFDLK